MQVKFSIETTGKYPKEALTSKLLHKQSHSRNYKMQFVAFLVLLLLFVVLLKGVQVLLRYDTDIGYRRVAYVVSAFWLGVPLLIMLATRKFDITEVDEQAWVAWTLLAVIPNALFWSLLWIMKGFRKNEND